jgi:hypothetical protein
MKNGYLFALILSITLLVGYKYNQDRVDTLEKQLKELRAAKSKTGDAMSNLQLPTLNFSGTPIQKFVETLNVVSADIAPDKEGVKLVILDSENIDYRVTTSIQNTSYRAALDLALKGSGLEYFVDSKCVVIQKKVRTLGRDWSNGVELASREQKSAIYTIKTKNRVSTITKTEVGTGFLAKIKGKFFIVTNLHVIRGCSDQDSIEIRNISGDRLTVGNVYAGHGHDLAIMQVTPPNVDTYAYEFLDDINSITKGDGILIVGNPLGEGTILEAKGALRGFGPQIIEYDAATFSGNSGSPVIHIPTQKVIGVHTYVSTLGLDNIFSKDAISKPNSPLSGTARRFGTRFDSIKKWEPLVWAEWVRQDKQMDVFWTRLYSFRSLASASGISFDRQAVMLTPDLWKAYERYEIDMSRTPSTQGADDAVKRVLFNIDALVGSSGGYLNEIRKAKTSFFSHYQNELETIENDQIQFNELWGRHKINVLHAVEVANAKNR